jgi:PAS domain S-box-containing protein
MPEEEIMDLFSGRRRTLKRRGASVTEREQIDGVAIDNEASILSGLPQALPDSERCYHLLADNLTGVIWTTDLNLTLTYISPSIRRVVGYSVEEVTAKTMEELLTPASFEVATKTIAEEIAIENTGQKDLFRSRTLVLELNCKDGSTVLTEAEMTFLRDSDSQPIGILGVLRDITERKRAEEETEKIEAQFLQAQKMEAIGTLAGGIAHDFNNLITAIQGYSYMAKMGIDETDPLYRNLKKIDAICLRAAKITRRLLLFSRKEPMEYTYLNINEIVEDLLKMLKRIIGEDIAIDTCLEPDILTVRADAGNIEQVIMNLAVNAREAMPKGGKLTITTENVKLTKEQCKAIPETRLGRYVCLSVADTGVGMDKKIIQYIFEPFFSTKELREGTGLGLSVVYGIIKQHGGWINVYSEHGQGSTFKLYMPAVPGKPEAKTDETILAEELRGIGERILLVEDDGRVREFLAEALTENGYVVIKAVNAREALDIFDTEEENFHLVFADVVLPDISGFQLVEQLLSRKPELPFLLGSGYMDNRLQWPAIREKGFQLLQKPYALAELLHAVREAIRTAKVQDRAN